jgi:hypothetical protein
MAQSGHGAGLRAALVVRATSSVAADSFGSILTKEISLFSFPFEIVPLRQILRSQTG